LRKDTGKTCKINVDGADFKIYNQKPFTKDDYSFKFNGPGVRYEVASNIQTGDIVWINGPFKPGKFNDIQNILSRTKEKVGRSW
jgi:hypothetical protein